MCGRAGTLVVIASLLVAGCEQSPPTCRKAMERLYPAAYPYHPQPGWLLDQREDAIAACETTQGAASDAGCLRLHERWREAVYEITYFPETWLDAELRWAALQACLNGVPFEEQCDDGLDNDGDGNADCFDLDCALRCVPPGSSGWTTPLTTERDVDILFVVDNSGSMAGEQANLRANFPALMASLKNMNGGLPNVHLGVTSTDLGTGMFSITYCEEVGGDAGNLVTGACANPVGRPYIIDVEPQSCEITKNEDNTCASHSCGQTHCAHEPTTSFVVDAVTGCPRCRNYQGETLEDVFSCIADLGTLGCGFEQPLEAMYKALEPGNAANAGFLREDAFLAVMLMTDEDDCSASDPGLYDNTQTDIDSPLGPLTSYRCFEFGISCDVNDRTHVGTRQSCVPREDADAMLHPLSRYIQLLQALKDPQMLVVAAIAGPVTPSPSGAGLNMVVALDEMSNPDLQYSCTTAVDGAVPGIRLYNLIEAFNEEQDIQSWAYSSICSADYTPALQGIGNKIKDILGVQCLPSPLKGCADVGVEYGTPMAANTCAVNERCLPECNVSEIRFRGTEYEYEAWIPPCLEVCPEGYCEGNTEYTQAYAGGHPARLDPALPVEACWHIAFTEACPSSRYSELRAARRAEPPPRSFLQFACKQISRDEQLCNDGLDNDEDCLVDLDDPCCQNPANCEGY